MVEEKRGYSKLAIWGFVLILAAYFFVLLGGFFKIDYLAFYLIFPLFTILSLILSFLGLSTIKKKRDKGIGLIWASLLADFLAIIFIFCYLGFYLYS